MPDDSSVAQDDLAAILRELGLGDHARPQSPHEVVQELVLPTIRAWRMALEAAGVPTTAGHEEAHRRMEDQFRDAFAAGAITLNPAPTGRLRRGSRVGRTLYDEATDANPGGRFVGCVDTPELAAEIVAAVNHWRGMGEGVSQDGG